MPRTFVHSSISSSCAIDRGTSLPDHETAGTMSVSQTKLQTVQIVLPVHANHHGTTFGGQVSLPPKCSFRPPLDNFYDEGLQYIITIIRTYISKSSLSIFFSDLQFSCMSIASAYTIDNTYVYTYVRSLFVG